MGGGRELNNQKNREQKTRRKLDYIPHEPVSNNTIP